MFLRRLRTRILLLAIVAALGARADAQSTITDGLVDKFNAFLPLDHSRSMTISELCHRLDCLAEELRDDGLVVVKQPDVFSQARMTRFRNDFENQMSTDLANFHLVLAARINRLDSATTTSTTALGAALAAPGTTNVQAPTATAAGVLGTTNNLFSGGASLFGSQPVQAQGPFANLGLATNNFNPITPASGAAASALGLGVDPTVYLEEKRRFLDHLNQIRRINLGPDQNDSSGYGLYLVRVPVSITPGECTYQGYGTDLAVTVEHEFTPDFLPTTFHNLVINDVVDQLGPVIYEALRSSAYENHLVPRHQARQRRKALEGQTQQLLDSLQTRLNQAYLRPPGAAVAVRDVAREEIIARSLTDYLFRTGRPVSDDSTNERLNRSVIADRLESTIVTPGSSGYNPADVSEGTVRAEAIRRGETVTGAFREDMLSHVKKIVEGLGFKWRQGAAVMPIDLPSVTDYEDFRLLMMDLYAAALPDDVAALDALVGLPTDARTGITQPLAQAIQETRRIAIDQESNTFSKVVLPSVRTPKQAYPIAPREVIDFFLEENIYMLAKDAKEASRTATIRSNEVRDYLRHTLAAAYPAMLYPSERAPERKPPLANKKFMSDLLTTIHMRVFRGSHGEPSGMERTYDEMVKGLDPRSRDNIREQPMAALCWAIAVDAALLDEAFRVDARKVFATHGLPTYETETVHFYYPGVQPVNRLGAAVGAVEEFPNPEGKAVFQEYVRRRWPIITFALDPVTDQQNIADSFNLKSDLQLAVSFAFATGQINFNQMNTFRRQIEQSSDTIALNRTVTGFANDTNLFEFRFTPRFQNPPAQKTNLAVITSQLISGGPGPNYQIKKSKLEPGMRELTAILLIPTFLPTMRMNLSTNWFKLTDPEHLIFHTGRMMERGRRVQELRAAAAAICNAHEYREADYRVLQAKLEQLEAMLPMQSRVVQLPFENSANGFDLFSEGSTALVPELTGFSGSDTITAPGMPAVSSTPAAGTTPPATFSVTTLATTTPPTVATYNIAGGTTSIADIFVFGKYISLLDSRVIAGGRSASFEILSREVVHVQIPANVIPTTTEDGQTYIEIYVATPNGISNSLLVPYKPAAPSPQVAYDVPAGSQSINLFYQWLTAPDGTHELVPTVDPGNKGITITWDSGTGLAPRRIQAQFTANVGGQTVSMILQAAAATQDDYTIDTQRFAVTLLKRLQEFTVYPALPTSPITFSVSVQPWQPADSEGLRVRTDPKPLKSKVTVNLQYNATDSNALPGVAPVIPPPAGTSSSRVAPPVSPGDPRLAAARGRKDPALTRTAQQGPAPSLPPIMNLPQPPPVLNTPTLLSPNVSSEAEQVAKLLTGKPVPTTVSVPPTSLPQMPASAQATVSALTAATPGATAAAPSQVPPIIVNPSPVVVVSPPPPKAKKHSSRLHQMFNRIGNRVSEARPAR
jgi:hypothetical protein